jgi:Patatin-like phospholipase
MCPLSLTELDGGGLQALSTLSILSKLCDAIAINKGTDRKPAPYELFDIIAGIGTGGWLALLLGRYRLDLTRCMSIYLELASDPQITATRPLFGSRHYTLDQKRLIAKIDSILKRYELSPLLLDDEIQQADGAEVRCKHAFALGAVQSSQHDGPKYEIFRSYPTTKTFGSFYHPGPDPGACKVSSACAATGATKYLLEPYTIGSTTFSDNGFPNPHNITDLALDEAYHIYGEKPPLSVIVNIGPGIPSDNDIEKLQNLSRKFSWPTWLQSNNRSGSLSEKSSSATNSTPTTMVTDSKIMESPVRSETSSSSSSLAEEVERRIEANIKGRLSKDYQDQEIFIRLAPPPARDELALNDVHVISASSEEVDNFLKQDRTKDLLKEAARRYCVTSDA